jgi:Mn-dependent DtxR family transcriptional regulator
LFRVNACIVNGTSSIDISISMIIGSEFSNKYQRFLKEIGRLSQDDHNHEISVKELNTNLDLDRTEIKNVLEYFQELGYINIQTIGGPLLYGHIRITKSGLAKYKKLRG